MYSGSLQAGTELESVYLPVFEQVFQVAFDEGISPFKDFYLEFMQNLAFKNTAILWGNKLLFYWPIKSEPGQISDALYFRVSSSILPSTSR